MSTAQAPANSAAKQAQPGLLWPILGVVAAVGLLALGMFLGGRRDEQLTTLYGRRRGTEAIRSVNGTSVLAEMFKRRGNRVSTMSRLSPKVNDFDVLVWIPNNFEPPTREQREFIHDWLAQGQQRTAIYVGRDYDAAVDYWDHVAPLVPPAQSDEALRRQAEARSAHEAARSKMPDQRYAQWFAARRDKPPKKIDALSGEFATGIDPAKADLHLEGRLAVPRPGDRLKDDSQLPEKTEVLLAAGEDALVTRLTDKSDWGDGQVIVVANGSLVLNYPLVNHENRKIADRLIGECGAPGRVVFIESGPDGPPVLDKEPASGTTGSLELLKVWPLNAILMHATFLGIVFCLARSPIFGRPQELPAPSTSDFGKHVAALGQLLARSRDGNYAQARLAQYRQIAERKSGRSHLKAKA